MTYRTSFTAAAQADREETIVDGRFSSSGDIALSDGTATQGAIYFADDKNTGIYSPSNNQIAFTTDGSANVILGGSALVHIKAGSQHWSQGLLLEDSAGGDGWNFYPDPDSGGEFFIGYNDDVVGSPNTSTTVFKLKGSDKLATFSGDIKIESTMPRIWLTDTNSDSDFSLYNGNGTFTIKDETTTALPIRIYSGTGSDAGAVQIDGNLDATAGIDVTGDVKINKSGDASLNIRDISANAVSNWIEVDSSDGLAIYNCYKEGVGTAYPHVFKGYTTEYARIDAAGIKFNGDTASANGLDDYEEGTFGLDLSGSGGSITEGSDDKLSYTKIGRQVFISGRIYISAISSPTGDLTLSGLPFPNQAADETSEKAYLAVIPHNWTYDADGLWWEISAGASNGPVQRQKTGVIHGNKLAASAVIAGSYLVITGSYHSSV